VTLTTFCSLDIFYIIDFYSRFTCQEKHTPLHLGNGEQLMLSRQCKYDVI
jgi:hypothetical protein